MSIFNDKALKGVAEAAAKILQQEQLKGNQHKIDANKNGKIDAHDFKLLRGKKDMKKEEVEQIDELSTQTLSSYVKKRGTQLTGGYNDKSKVKGINKAITKVNSKKVTWQKEEVELNEEDAYSKDRYAVKNGKAMKDNPSHKGSDNYKDQPHHVWATSAEEAMKKKMKKEDVQLDEAFPSVEDAKKRMDAETKKSHDVKKVSTGTVYTKKAKEDEPKKMKESLSFSEMLELYNEHGLKVLAPIETEEMDVDGTTIEVIDADKINGVVDTIVEEPDNAQFTKELKDQEASAAGKKPQPKVAAGKTTGVKTMPESIELDERTLSSGETNKKEEIVKSMKKNLSGFKQRYGDRAKEVMYATATKMAKKG